MTAEWTVSAPAPTPGWVLVPTGLMGERVDAWAAESLAALREPGAPGSEWGDDLLPQAQETLVSAAKNRGTDKLLELLCWPLPVPVAVRVGVQVGPSRPVASWIDAGFEVDSFDSAESGPGVRCIAMKDCEIDGQQRALITTHYRFDDGHNMVLVVIEPTLLQLYNLALPSTLALVNDLEVRDPNGRFFVPLAQDGYTLPDEDRFVGSAKS